MDIEIKETSKFYCETCKSIYPCSTQNFGIECDYELEFLKILNSKLENPIQDTPTPSPKRHFL